MMATRYQPAGTEPYDPELVWLLCEAASALGERGTLQGTIAALERGGVSGGGYDAESALGQIVELGTCQRYRRLIVRWRLVTPADQQILAAYYVAISGAAHAVAEEVGKQLGVYGCVVMVLNAADEKRREIERACRVLVQNPESFRASDAGRAAAVRIAKPLGVAQRAVAKAHERWQNTRATVALRRLQ